MPDRRDLLLAPLFAALIPTVSHSSPLDPTQTNVTLPAGIAWKAFPDAPKDSIESAVLFGSHDATGLYYELIKWYPGYMSAPHSYATDRVCVVVSGTWWVNSGADFDPARCIPVPAGGYVRRVARTPHYDGVIATGKEPAVIAICGMAPVKIRALEPGKPFVRKVG